MKKNLHSLGSRALVAAAAVFAAMGTAGAQVSRAAPAAPDTIMPDTTVTVTTDAEGRVWVEEFALGMRDGQARTIARMAGPPSGVGPLGFIVWLPHHPDWHGRANHGETFAPEQPVVKSVVAGSNAEAVGLRPGDVVLTVDGTDARTSAVWHDLRGGRVMALHVRRGGRERDVRVTVGPTSSREEVERRLRLEVACMRHGFPHAATEDAFNEVVRACKRAHGW